MKVVVEGILQSVPGSLVITGWMVDLGREYPTIQEGEGRTQFGACVLIHIGRKLGVELVEASAAASQAEEIEQPLPECFDAQREALDAIAVARWLEQGE